MSGWPGTSFFKSLRRLHTAFHPRRQRIDTATQTFVVLDTETTGFDYEKDRILSIGALKLSSGNIRVDESLELYIAQAHYDSATTKVHGILRRERKPMLPEAEALERFLEYADGHILVAHHAYFDLNMINGALVRHGLPRLVNKVLDTATLYRKTLISSPLLPKKDSYALDELAEKFDISRKDRHTALGDAYITAIAFLKIAAILKQQRKPIGDQYLR